LFASLHGHPQQEFPSFLGYAVAEIGVNTVNVLLGFEGG